MNLSTVHSPAPPSPVKVHTPQAVKTTPDVPSGALSTLPEFAPPEPILRFLSGNAPTLAPPLGMDEEAYMLALNSWAADFADVVLANAKENIQQTIDMQRAKLKNKVADLREMHRKQDAEAAARRKNRIIGWVTKSLTMVALVVAATAATGVAAVTGGAATPLAAVMILMAAAAVTDFASHAHTEIHGEGAAFSLNSGLQAAGLSATDATYLSAVGTADLGGLMGQIAKECTDDEDLILAMTITGTVLQTALMAGAGASSAAKSAANASKLVTGIQIAGVVAGGAANVASGVQQLEIAAIEKEIAGMVANLARLNAMLEMIDKVLKGQIDLQAEYQKQAMKVQEAAAEIVLSMNERMLGVAQSLSRPMS